MNAFEQCISEWADRCREAQAECRRIEVVNAQLQARVKELENEVERLNDCYNEVLIRPSSDYAQLQATLAAREARIAELEALQSKSEQRMNDIMSNTRLLRREFDMWEARLAELRSDD